MSKVEKFEDLKVWKAARDLCKMLKSLILYLQDSDLKGNKFK